MIYKKKLFLLIFFAAVSVKAETLSFETIWSEIKKSSSAMQAADLQKEALREGLSRADRHWLPRLYLDARAYQTNDPSSAFFGILQQRQVTASDFTPSDLNHPSDKTFTQGAIGLDWALYEGGLKSAQVDMYSHSLQAQKFAAQQVELEQFTQTAMAYANIALAEKQTNKLQRINDELNKLIKNYQLGSRSNPVGYSGLLGMKSLANRISGLLTQMKAQGESQKQVLKEMGLNTQEWSPEKIESEKFVEKYLNVENSERSFKSRALLENVKVSESLTQMEQARFLPRIGAFAESYLFKGDRDIANGYTAGLYLQWSLFDPSDFGRLSESRLKSQASAKYVEASLQQERAERQSYENSIQALHENLKLLSDSDKLMEEQAKMSSVLFKNGSISALQFVEILNRRVDLIDQQTQAESQLLKSSVEYASRNGELK